MTTATRERTDEPEASKGPSLIVVVAIALVAIAATAATILLELASDHAGPDPGLQASLHAWLILPYALCGLFAWYRKPESRLGPLMLAAGFATLLSSISAANSNLVFTIGTAFDLIPFAVFEAGATWWDERRPIDDEINRLEPVLRRIETGPPAV